MSKGTTYYLIQELITQSYDYKPNTLNIGPHTFMAESILGSNPVMVSLDLHSFGINKVTLIYSGQFNQ